MFLFAASNGESAKEVMLTLENAKCTCLHRSPMRHLGTRGQVAGKLAHKPNSHRPPPPTFFSGCGTFFELANGTFGFLGRHKRRTSTSARRLY